jgi:hypothetical protein
LHLVQCTLQGELLQFHSRQAVKDDDQFDYVSMSGMSHELHTTQASILRS